MLLAISYFGLGAVLASIGILIKNFWEKILEPLIRTHNPGFYQQAVQTQKSPLGIAVQFTLWPAFLYLFFVMFILVRREQALLKELDELEEFMEEDGRMGFAYENGYKSELAKLDRRLDAYVVIKLPNNRGIIHPNFSPRQDRDEFVKYKLETLLCRTLLNEQEEITIEDIRFLVENDVLPPEEVLS